MRLISILVILFSSAIAQAEPAKLFCQNWNSQSGYVTYVDLYADYNSATNLYSKIEFDAYSFEDNFVYPNLFWKVEMKADTATGMVNITAKKDVENYLKFQLPGEARGINLSRTEGVADNFEFQGQGMIYGAPLKGLFTCYDAVAFIQTPVGELPDDISLDEEQD